METNRTTKSYCIHHSLELMRSFCGMPNKWRLPMVKHNKQVGRSESPSRKRHCEVTQRSTEILQVRGWERTVGRVT